MRYILSNVKLIFLKIFYAKILYMKKDDNFIIYFALFLLVGVLMAVYYFIDAQWLNPDNYSLPTDPVDAVYESRDEGEFYAP